MAMAKVRKKLRILYIDALSNPTTAVKRTKPKVAIRRAPQLQIPKSDIKRMSPRDALDTVSLHVEENNKLEVLQL